MTRRHQLTVADATRLSRRRKVALMRACYRNAKEYAALSRIAHGRRMYGKAYALGVLGLEQVGATLFWEWLASDSWESLPKELRTHLEGGTKGKSLLSDHARKQDALGFTVLVLFFLLGHSAEARYSRNATISVFARRASRRIGLLVRAYAKDFEVMQERKFRGLYVDPEKGRLRTPWEIGAGESTRIFGLLRWLVALLRADVHFPSTPLQSRRFREALERTMGDVEAYIAQKPSATAGQVQTYAGRSWEARLREATYVRRRQAPPSGSSGEEE